MTPFPVASAATLPLLVVEDDDDLREAIRDTLELAGEAVAVAASGPAALALLEQQAFGMVFSDVRMDPMDGIALLKEIRARLPQLPVVLMTAYADVDRAVEAMRAGACDFLLKPFEPKSLLAHAARHRLTGAPDDAGVVAADAASQDLFALADRVAQTDATVLLTGESGVGKEVVARFIHRHSARRGGPFVAINCAAIPDSLLEATLFGHEKGAFTGATSAQPGKFEQAQDGTLLLDEVTEMPLSLQAKLLRVLQEREVERVGGKKPVALDIRIIATSNRDMADAVRAGAFREDLYYRLNVFPLPIPALRQRPADVVPLARQFLAARAAQFGRGAVRLSPAAAAALMAHDWPGNVRELENVVQRALILATGDSIEPADLRLTAAALHSPVAGPRSGIAAGTPPGDVLPGASALAGSEPGKAGYIKDLEREHILSTLSAVGGSRKLAGERLGLSERTLRHKLRQYRLSGHLKE